MKTKTITAYLLFASVLIFGNSTFAVTAESPVSEVLPEVQEQHPTYDALLGDLNAKSFKAKINVVEQLSTIRDPRVLPTLKLMLDGALYYRKSDKMIVTVEKVDGGLALTSVLTQEPIGTVGKRDAKKITINNQLRNTLRTAVAILELSAEDRAMRLASARNLIKSPDDNLRSFLAEAAKKETSEGVRHLLHVAIARIDIKSDDRALRLAAVEKLGTAVEPEAVSVLRQLVEKNDAGEYLETDSGLVAIAEQKLKVVETKLGVYKFTENLLFGLSLGSVLLLAAIGLAITF